MPPTGTYSNYHPFAHLSDFCVPVNFDNSATYFGAAAVYANSYPSHNFGIKAEQASCSTTLLNDAITSYTNLDEGKENINPMRSRSTSLGAKEEKESEVCRIVLNPWNKKTNDSTKNFAQYANNIVNSYHHEQKPPADPYY
uniref:Uncharacterized protein n=1 Tax=Acrobeloides nanus TaxID=290746 RepID=A0A914C9Z5_9BILA